MLPSTRFLKSGFVLGLFIISLLGCKKDTGPRKNSEGLSIGFNYGFNPLDNPPCYCVGETYLLDISLTIFAGDTSKYFVALDSVFYSKNFVDTFPPHTKIPLSNISRAIDSFYFQVRSLGQQSFYVIIYDNNGNYIGGPNSRAKNLVTIDILNNLLLNNRTKHLLP
ncbi:MAG: hypothetical protein QM528_06625 [Phycisphaerales bacterium]|nr:hypothetical protein [Phycisphaerales bacterium]